MGNGQSAFAVSQGPPKREQQGEDTTVARAEDVRLLPGPAQGPDPFPLFVRGLVRLAFLFALDPYNALVARTDQCQIWVAGAGAARVVCVIRQVEAALAGCRKPGLYINPHWNLAERH